MSVRVGVVGWPVAHSRSPAIFAHWFERYAIDASYELIPVRPEAADDFFAALPAEFRGVNVTLPHKKTAAAHVALTGAGARLGVVNTLWRDGETVRGTSSDGAGFLASLDAAAPEWQRGDALVLGAGGAAVAVVDALRARGVDVLVANRTHDKAVALAASLGAKAIAWERLGEALGEVRLLVNATSLGMDGMPALDLDLGAMPYGSTVADIVYTPLLTPLLAAAEARGLVAVDGLGMLLHQATVGFERWFGIAPEVDEALHRAVSATL